jgi:hypothetical protein
MLRVIKRLALGIILCAGLCDTSVLHAQYENGSLVGTIHDGSGAAVSGAIVRIGQRRDLAHPGGASALARIVSTLAISHGSRSGRPGSCRGNAAYHLTIRLL